MAKSLSVGNQVTIPAGTKVTVNGTTTKRQVPAQVTIRDIQTTKSGNAKVSWKSHGYRATAILKA